MILTLLESIIKIEIKIIETQNRVSTAKKNLQDQDQTRELRRNIFNQTQDLNQDPLTG